MIRSRQLPSGLLLISFACLFAQHSFAAGNVSVCDEPHLKTALVGGGTVTFTCAGTITLTQTIQITSSTVINGNHQAVHISGGKSVTVFSVNPDAVLFLAHVEEEEGHANIEGGAIFNRGTVFLFDSKLLGNNAPSGGAIANYGTLFLLSSQVDLNNARRGAAIINYGHVTMFRSQAILNNATGDPFGLSGIGGGGAIYNLGNLVVRKSDLSGNSSESEISQSGGTIRVGAGGAILNSRTSVLAVSETTFRANSAGDSGLGGAIYNLGTATVTQSTFIFNAAAYGGAIITGSFDRSDIQTLFVGNSTFVSNSGTIGAAINNSASVTTVEYSTFSGNSGRLFQEGAVFNTFDVPLIIRNSILADPGPDCHGPIRDEGYNLEQGSSCGFSSSNGSLSNINPDLGPLGNYGGSTQTLPLFADSPAIDKIPPGVNGCGDRVVVDQRGVTRPQGSNCDIGAYEVNPSGPPPGGRCIGGFTGPFIGDLFIGPDSTCSFLGGSVTGNIHLEGGVLNLSNVSVKGNIQATAGSLSIDPLTNISGNLEIHNLTGTVNQTRICGATIEGSLEIHNNSSSIWIGSDPLNSGPSVSSNFCMGNQISGDVHVHNNSAPLQIFGNIIGGDLHVHNNVASAEVTDNTVAGRLDCHNNDVITGGPNLGSQRARGQCYEVAD